MTFATVFGGAVALIGLLTWGLKLLVSARERRAGRDAARLEALDREAERVREKRKIVATSRDADANELQRDLE